jgi:hypothetical protein
MPSILFLLALSNIIKSCFVVLGNYVLITKAPLQTNLPPSNIHPSIDIRNSKESLL